MGGRRARSLSEIVGAGLGPQRASFSRAIGAGDAQAVASSSAKLIEKSDKVADILYYASKVADFVARTAQSKQELDYEQRVHLARQEWSRVKKQENLEDDPIITNAIVNAAAKAMAKGSK